MKRLVAALVALSAGSLLWASGAAPAQSVARAAASPVAETPAQRRGRLLYLQCRACHELRPSGAELVGPHLGGIVGRKVAAVEDFEYSAALAAQSFVWDRDRLDRWLERPGALVPGNTMAFAGIPNADDRAALIDHLEAATAPR